MPGNMVFPIAERPKVLIWYSFLEWERLTIYQQDKDCELSKPLDDFTNVDAVYHRLSQGLPYGLCQLEPHPLPALIYGYAIDDGVRPRASANRAAKGFEPRLPAKITKLEYVWGII
jgi:hypothetical protein